MACQYRMRAAKGRYPLKVICNWTLIAENSSDCRKEYTATESLNCLLLGLFSIMIKRRRRLDCADRIVIFHSKSLGKVYTGSEFAVL